MYILYLSLLILPLIFMGHYIIYWVQRHFIGIYMFRNYLPLRYTVTLLNCVIGNEFKQAHQIYTLFLFVDIVKLRIILLCLQRTRLTEVYSSLRKTRSDMCFLCYLPSWIGYVCSNLCAEASQPAHECARYTLE